ncbi:RagB/SusD family nutrient uptake outer membrane protein [Hymenobacter crusticola]|uniref:RagB/SusD family nutrient uptake outer membrane protein n=1 Tax=Hymenobacter crusticola TaxID=1770526 RepID=A0A243WEX4_9BACT|nr:RagB/SusD family nutrient uptake outer membrane protein [Hymenobacter crusticola]OUJ74019.1 RagB/SusD family nutrient uptake outer membrane protein [Hymenobacter crusticola]
MKLSYKTFILSLGLLTGLSACEKDFLDRESPTIVKEDQIWNDPNLITSLLANYYDRLPSHSQIDAGWEQFTAYDEALWAGNGNGPNDLFTFGTNRWTYWDYGLIRDINLALDNLDKFSTTLSDTQKTQFKSELRFLRAYVYFEMVKRMGGVPIITNQLIYDFSGDASALQNPRNKESEVYDFIASELDAIKGTIGNDGSNTRANRYTAMALKSRAMLYAASIAKYNSLSGLNIQTAGGEVGIPSSRATEYYQKSLDASKEVIAGPYALYKTNPNLGENFFDAITKKAPNSEVIFAKDFLTAKSRRHGFTYDNIPRGIREDNLSSSIISPILNLVEAYEYLDGTSGQIRTRNAADTDYIYYDNLSAPFANKDARLYGTVIYPGTTFRGQEVQIQAGVKVWNATTNDYQTIEGGLSSNYGGTAFPTGDGKLLTGSSGPQATQVEVSNTGFYLRKYIDPVPKTSTRGILSDVWWVRFRLGEVLLNASEAALELGQTSDALTYVNRVRERAGFPANSLTASTLNIARLQNERRVELAFEDHRVWDLKRWRIAHQVWNGNANTYSAVAYVLFPYRVVRPGSPLDGKYVFDRKVAPRFRTPRNFQVLNYYSFIDQSVINNNPKIVRNPFQ